jgi:hypothetical protein
MSEQAAADNGDSSQPAHQLRSGSGAAAAEAGAQQQESPQFIGVISCGNAERQWYARARIDTKSCPFARCSTRAEAAAAYDLALIWKRLHGKGRATAGG